MDIYTIHHEKINGALYWGKRRIIEEDIPARLTWQPLQEVRGNLWLHPRLFGHPMWKNYRPDWMQPLFFRVSHGDAIQTIWVDEYDVKAYVRGWKNVPVFRLKKIEFTSKTAFKKRKLSYKKAEAWFVVPGALVAGDEEAEIAPVRTVGIPVFQKEASAFKELLNEHLDHCQVQIYSGGLDNMPVTLVHITENEALQGNPAPDYNLQFKVQYDIMCGVLALLTQQNLKPVWQVLRRTGKQKKNWLQLLYYEEGAPGRNGFPQDDLFKGDYSFSALHSSLMRLSLPKFSDCINDIHRFEKVLAIHDVLPRFEKATELLSRLIGWRGGDIGNWPEKLKEALDTFHLSHKGRFIDEEVFSHPHFERGYWYETDSPLDSLKDLVAGRSPAGIWFAGKRIKERNEVVMQLIADLIIGKHLSEP